MASVANVYAWSASGNVSGLEMANMATCQVTPSSSTSAVTSNQGQGFLIRYGEYHISLMSFHLAINFSLFLNYDYCIVIVFIRSIIQFCLKV